MSRAGRPSVRVDHVRGWMLKENPRYPECHGDMTVACHDGSPFVTIICSCKTEMHIHETQIPGMDVDDEIFSMCRGCKKPLAIGGRWMLAAFDEVKQRMKSNL